MATLDGLNPAFLPWAKWILEVGRYHNLNPRLTSGFRSFAKQQQLYERYLRGENAYPVAPPGASMHNYGLAIDFVSADNEWLGAIWKRFGGCWGGSADPVHFAWACRLSEVFPQAK